MYSLSDLKESGWEVKYNKCLYVKGNPMQVSYGSINLIILVKLN
jgi:hypothetical protein